MRKLSVRDYRKLACSIIKGHAPKEALQSQEFWTLAQADALLPVLWSMLDDSEKNEVKPQLLLPISAQVQAADSLRMKNTTLRVLRAFKQAGIPMICLRGLTLSHKLYPQPYLRPFTDIDILIHPKDSLMAKQVIGNVLHFSPVPAYPSLFKQGDIPLDLHIEPIGIERIKSWKHLTPLSTADFFKHAKMGTIAGEETLLVEASVLLPYLCFHAQKHSFDRMIWLYDIKLLAAEVEREKQWDNVQAGIKEFKLERPCYYALSYLKTHMATEVPGYILDAIRPEFGFIEKRLYARFMNHEIVPYLAERLFSRMLPDFKHRVAFWSETIYPDEKVRKQIAGGGCVKCNFIRTRLKQIFAASLSLGKELFLISKS